MHIFNKIIVVILLLFLAVASIVSIVNIFVGLYDIADIADRVVAYFAQANQFILALVLFLILAVCLVLLVLEFYRKKKKTASISRDQSGETTITLKTVSNQIKERISKMENVIDPKVKIVPKNDGIIINIFSELVKGDNVTQKTEDIRRTATDYAVDELGFKVLKTNYTATGFQAPKQEKKETPAEKQSTHAPDDSGE